LACSSFLTSYNAKAATHDCPAGTQRVTSRIGSLETASGSAALDIRKTQ
jgi:hypothetical protein